MSPTLWNYITSLSAEYERLYPDLATDANKIKAVAIMLWGKPVENETTPG